MSVAPWVTIEGLACGALLVFSIACSQGTNEAVASESCEQEPLTLKILYGDAVETYLALDRQQYRAIGRLEPDIPDPEQRRLLACTGTLVAPSWVLSASHCVRRADQGLLFVTDPGSGAPLTRRVLRRFQSADDDVLLMKLEPASNERSPPVIPIALPPDLLEVGDLVQLAGYGVREDGDLGELRFVVEPVSDVSEAYWTVDGRGRTGACGGDSGGPLLARGQDGSVRVFGVLSMGSADCQGLDLFAKLKATDPRWGLLPQSCAMEGCGALTTTGRCLNGDAVYCDHGSPRRDACEGGHVCGYSQAMRGFRCVAAETTDCPGFDAFGRCLHDRAETCVDGNAQVTDCAAASQACELDGSGRARCE